ncbi:unnamed protein product, partial [Gulo gulo]
EEAVARAQRSGPARRGRCWAPPPSGCRVGELRRARASAVFAVCGVGLTLPAGLARGTSPQSPTLSGSWIPHPDGLLSLSLSLNLEVNRGAGPLAIPPPEGCELSLEWAPSPQFNKSLAW